MIPYPLRNRLIIQTIYTTRSSFCNGNLIFFTLNHVHVLIYVSERVQTVVNYEALCVCGRVFIYPAQTPVSHAGPERKRIHRVLVIESGRPFMSSEWSSNPFCFCPSTWWVCRVDGVWQESELEIQSHLRFLLSVRPIRVIRENWLESCKFVGR